MGASGPIALLVAAGSGSRLGAAVRKAFVELAGRPMLEWSLDALRAAGISEIVVALPPDAAAPDGGVGGRGGTTRSEAAGGGGGGVQECPLCPARGGAVGGHAPPPAPADPVVVHDAARPLVDPEL